MRNLLWVYETNKIQGRHFCKDLQKKKTVKDFVVDRDKINIYCSRVYSLRTQKLQQNQPSQIKKKKINIKLKQQDH